MITKSVAKGAGAVTRADGMAKYEYDGTVEWITMAEWERHARERRDFGEELARLHGIIHGMRNQMLMWASSLSID